MYYITNHTGHVIAASSDLLELLELKSIDSLYKKIALNAIEFTAEDNGIRLKTPLDETYYRTEEESLSSILGSMTLIHLIAETSTATSEEKSTSTQEESSISLEDDFSLFEGEEPFEVKEEHEETELPVLEELNPESVNLPDLEEAHEKEELFSLLDDEEPFDIVIAEKEEIEESEKTEEQQAIVSSTINTENEDEELFSLIDDEPFNAVIEANEKIQLSVDKESGTSSKTHTENESEEAFPILDEEETFSIKEDEKDTLFNLVLPSNAEETLNAIEDKTALSNAPVYIDVEKTAQSIGISPEDYNSFLTEYIDTALSLEDDLKSDDKGKRTAAIHTLFHLSNVLRLPVITEIIEQLKYTEAEDISNTIQSFYDTLGRLTTSESETKEITKKTDIEVEEKEADKLPETPKGFGTIDLSDVKPIHFDFRVEEAADDLSLPTELIEEFIHDFIKQAHEETDKMLQAYENGDLDTIQKIGHLLKGTASNLRINPLSDTLYEIQFCDDASRLEPLIKEYWAHFIAFETQFNLQSQH